MRQKVLGAVVLLCLCGAGSAFAASGSVSSPPNSYTGNFAVAGGVGSTARPAAVAMSETLGMSSTTQGNVGAPLVNIKTTTYGVKAPNAGMFPKCTVARISANNGNNGKWNAVCPKGSLVATGSVTAALTSPTSNLAGPGAPCHLGLWVYNGGPGKLTFFFTTTPAQCDGLTTGDAAPWQGTVSEAGKYLVTNVPEPADVSYNAGNIGLFGSLESEVLHFKKMTVKKGKKTYPYMESIGCTKRSRPFTVTYSATQSNSGAPTEAVGTVKGRAGC
jgi:hypothetical protein